MTNTINTLADIKKWHERDARAASASVHMHAEIADLRAYAEKLERINNELRQRADYAESRLRAIAIAEADPYPRY